MHPVNLIANAIRMEQRGPDLPTEVGICCLTGDECETYERKKVFDKTFNKHLALQAPNSPRVGVDATIALSYKWERMSCWIVADGKFYRVGPLSKPEFPLHKSDVREIILTGRTPFNGHWAGYMTTSYKKHGVYTATVNCPNSGGIWGFEDMKVDCTNTEKCKKLFDVLLEAKSLFSTEEIETLDFLPQNIKRVGIEKTLEIIKFLTPYKNTPIFVFMLWLLPSREEMKENALNG